MESRLQGIETAAAPKPLGPYSQAIVAGGFVFVAGQVALDPATGALVGKGDIAAQTERALANMAAILESAGSSLARVVKVTIFLADFGQFQAMNAVYERFFSDPRPARSAVEIGSLPWDLLLEIECIALAADR